MLNDRRKVRLKEQTHYQHGDTLANVVKSNDRRPLDWVVIITVIEAIGEYVVQTATDNEQDHEEAHKAHDRLEKLLFLDPFDDEESHNTRED